MMQQDVKITRNNNNNMQFHKLKLAIGVALGAANFLDLIFYANPGDGDEYLPRPASTSSSVTAFNQSLKQQLATSMAQITTSEPDARC
ncbi:hypothetical protein [Endozoicomonas sp. 2B-B]